MVQDPTADIAKAMVQDPTADIAKKAGEAVTVALEQAGDLVKTFTSHIETLERVITLARAALEDEAQPAGYRVEVALRFLRAGIFA